MLRDGEEDCYPVLYVHMGEQRTSCSGHLANSYPPMEQKHVMSHYCRIYFVHEEPFSVIVPLPEPVCLLACSAGWVVVAVVVGGGGTISSVSGGLTSSFLEGE